MTFIQTAERIATEGHKGEYRRDGLTPYIVHPRSVAKRVRGHGEFVEAVAWLHDLLENNKDWSTGRLLKEDIPQEVVEAVWVLTKDPNLDYISYIVRVRANPIARIVKMHDILDNLSGEPTATQIRRYAVALLMLV